MRTCTHTHAHPHTLDVQRNEEPLGLTRLRRRKPETEPWPGEAVAAGCWPPHNPRSEPIGKFKFRFQMANLGKP